MTCAVINWTLSHEYIIYAWIPKELHKSRTYNSIKECYTGITTGEIIDNHLEILYKYNIPVTNLSKIMDNDYDNSDVYWQGYYNKTSIEFDFATRNKNKKYNIQTIEEVDGIIRNYILQTQSSTPSMTSIIEETIITTTTTTTTSNKNTNAINTNTYQSHKFKMSEGVILCEKCGFTQLYLIEHINNNIYHYSKLTSCIG